MSQRAKQLSAAIERQKRAKAAKPKHNATHSSEPERSSISRVTLSSEGVSVTLIPVQSADWPICIIGLQLLEKAIKAARKALTAVALDPELVARREAECSAILEGMRSDSPAIKLGINVDWLLTLRAGLSLEFDQTNKLAENQEALRLDPDETQVRVRQLDRLMSELDVAAMAGSGA